jgi:hypothetical protein
MEARVSHIYGTTSKGAVVFYFSLSDKSGGMPMPIAPGVVGYIRTEFHRGIDQGEALDNATPGDEESVMNSHNV